MLGMASTKVGCWEYSPFHCLALGNASLIGIHFSLFCPHHLLLHSQFENTPCALLQISLQSLSLASSSSSTLCRSLSAR